MHDRGTLNPHSLCDGNRCASFRFRPRIKILNPGGRIDLWDASFGDRAGTCTQNDPILGRA
jgi:hypothetical protein